MNISISMKELVQALMDTNELPNLFNELGRVFPFTTLSRDPMAGVEYHLGMSLDDNGRAACKAIAEWHFAGNGKPEVRYAVVDKGVLSYARRVDADGVCQSLNKAYGNDTYVVRELIK